MVAGMIWNESKLLHRNTQCQPDAVQKPLISSPNIPRSFHIYSYQMQASCSLPSGKDGLHGSKFSPILTANRVITQQV